MKRKFLNDVTQIDALSPADRQKIKDVSEMFSFYANDDYLSLIDWTDPEDPIRRIIIPHPGELEDYGSFDPSREADNYVVPGLQHKYPDTALLLVSDSCAGLCRYCFRKRVFVTDSNDVEKDIHKGLRYIARHPEINNVLLTGGDALQISTGRLEAIISALRDIPHVRIIRIGTKMPAFNPYRILNDRALLDVIRRYTELRRRIYVIAHFDHPRELTSPALEAIAMLQRAGATVLNQNPLIRGVNDDADTLAELWNELAYAGVVSHYLFQCRPVVGNRHLSVPIERGFALYSEALSRCAGTSSKCTYAMSHASGKLAILGMDDHFVYMRFARARDPRDYARQLVFRRNPKAFWLEDYEATSREDIPWTSSESAPFTLSLTAGGLLRIRRDLDGPQLKKPGLPTASGRAAALRKQRTVG